MKKAFPTATAVVVDCITTETSLTLKVPTWDKKGINRYDVTANIEKATDLIVGRCRRDGYDPDAHVNVYLLLFEKVAETGLVALIADLDFQQTVWCEVAIQH